MEYNSLLELKLSCKMWWIALAESKLEDCLYAIITGHDIEIVNECESPVRLHGIEVKYYVTGLRFEPDGVVRDVKRIRRVVTEKIRVSEEIKPRQRWKHYFGVVDLIIELTVEVEVGGKRILLSPRLERRQE